MKYKMLVCDYDMTLGVRPNIISEKNIAAIKQYQSEGGIFVLCTGRMLASINNILKEYDVHCDVIAYQGSLIVLKNGETLYDGGITVEDSYDFLRLAEQRGEHVNIFVGDTHFSNKLDEKTDFYEYSSRTPVFKLDCTASEYVKKNACRCRKIALMGEHGDFERNREFYAPKFPSLEINSGGYYLTEIISKSENKGKAVAIIAEKYGIKLNEIAAIGDSTNDTSMIKTAGFGVAVGDGSNELKKIADFIAPPFSEDPVAYVIEKFCL